MKRLTQIAWIAEEEDTKFSLTLEIPQSVEVETMKAEDNSNPLVSTGVLLMCAQQMRYFISSIQPAFKTKSWLEPTEAAFNFIHQ